MSMPDLSEWLKTPLGRYLMDWERAGLERMVADIFGYRAVQIGLPGVDLLAANRMPFRFRCARVGAAAVLVNTAIATAADPAATGRAFSLAVEAGRMAFLADLAGVSATAQASSPLTGFLDD